MKIYPGESNERPNDFVWYNMAAMCTMCTNQGPMALVVHPMAVSRQMHVTAANLVTMQRMWSVKLDSGLLTSFQANPEDRWAKYQVGTAFGLICVGTNNGAVIVSPRNGEALNLSKHEVDLKTDDLQKMVTLLKLSLDFNGGSTLRPFHRSSERQSSRLRRRLSFFKRRN